MVMPPHERCPQINFNLSEEVQRLEIRLSEAECDLLAATRRIHAFGGSTRARQTYRFETNTSNAVRDMKVNSACLEHELAIAARHIRTLKDDLQYRKKLCADAEKDILQLREELRNAS